MEETDYRKHPVYYRKHPGHLSWKEQLLLRQATSAYPGGQKHGQSGLMDDVAKQLGEDFINRINVLANELDSEAIALESQAETQYNSGPHIKRSKQMLADLKRIDEINSARGRLTENKLKIFTDLEDFLDKKVRKGEP